MKKKKTVEGLGYEVRKVTNATGQEEIQVMVVITFIDEEGDRNQASAVLTTRDFSAFCADIAMDISALKPKVAPVRLFTPENLKSNGSEEK